MDSGESGEHAMNHIHRKSPFWSLAGPLLAYWGIQLAVQFIIQAFIQVPYMTEAYMKQFASGNITDAEQAMESYMSLIGPAIELVMKYEVEITGAAALCTIPLTAILFRKDRKLEKDLGIGPAQRAPLKKYWMILVFGILGTVGVTCLSAMAQAVMYDEAYASAAQSMYSASFPVQVLALGIIVPAAEELMFRGIMFERYRENRNFWYSALWSSLFFSIMHTNTIQMVYSFLLGVLLSYLYERFGSLRAPMLMHIVLNTGALVFTEAGFFSWLAENLLRMSLTVIVCAFICSVMFVMIRQTVGEKKEDHSEKKKDSTNMFL